MIKTSRRFLLFLLALLLVPAGCLAAPQVGPLHLSGTLSGAAYVIDVPSPWNGTLIVFAHGYRDRADSPGEVDDRSAEDSPDPALTQALLAMGYALAGSAYKNNGWAVKEGLQDTTALTSFFRDSVAQPDHTILFGVSMGTVIGFRTIEQTSGLYDGLVAGCAVGAGASRTLDLIADFHVAYDATFGFPAAWGVPGNVRDDLDFEAEVLPVVVAQLSDPANLGKFEFIRRVVRGPLPGWYPPPIDNSGANFLLTDFYFSTDALAELQRRAGGPVVQNVDHFYSLTPQDFLELQFGFGVPPAVAQGWLDVMNAHRNIVPPQSARNYVEHYADYTGRIKHPVLTMHTEFDGFVVTSGENVYKQTVTDAGHEADLVQVYTNGIGHCAFTGPQIIVALTAMDSWVRTGVPPSPAAFPTALGFLPGFDPGPFPQPPQ